MAQTPLKLFQKLSAPNLCPDLGEESLLACTFMSPGLLRRDIPIVRLWRLWIRGYCQSWVICLRRLDVRSAFFRQQNGSRFKGRGTGVQEVTQCRCFCVRKRSLSVRETLAKRSRVSQECRRSVPSRSLQLSSLLDPRISKVPTVTARRRDWADPCMTVVAFGPSFSCCILGTVVARWDLLGSPCP